MYFVWQVQDNAFANWSHQAVDFILGGDYEVFADFGFNN